jgi:hypothetical protein
MNATLISGLWAITICNWLPQILNYIIPNSMALSPSMSYAICTFGLLYYPLAMTIFFKNIGPWLRENHGKGKTLRIWEIYVSTAWQVQTIGFTSLTLSTVPYLDNFESIPIEATTSIGIFLVVLGIVSKGLAIYMTGYNTYYCYDMVLDTPNAYFIKGGIYKYCASPMYTLGRFTGFGAALQFRSVPLFVASLLDLLLMNLYDYFIEQPFVKKMYMQVE